MSAQKTVQVELSLSLPGPLAREAKDRGLLTSESLEIWVRSELRRARVDRLFEASERLADLSIPPLTEEEINAEIRAARAARRGTRESRG